MKSNTTLMILAAGMGSRYGGLKQIESIGPNGETIMDYSIYDAMLVGFDKVVFIIQESFKYEFKQRMISKFGNKIQMAFISQDILDFPHECEMRNRTKPWGTAHAVWTARHVIQEPFVVINADDFYGRNSFFHAHQFAQQMSDRSYAVITYFLENTISYNGSVNRGICTTNGLGQVAKIIECKDIMKTSEGVYTSATDNISPLHNDTLVSMNMFVFHPSIFDHIEHDLLAFAASLEQNDYSSELVLPTVIDRLIQSREIAMHMVHSDATWFGVTYKADKSYVQEMVMKYIVDSTYPQNILQQTHLEFV